MWVFIMYTSATMTKPYTRPIQRRLYSSIRLYNVHGIQVKSLSVANEIYNIQQNNNNNIELVIFSYNAVTVVPRAPPLITTHTKVAASFPLGVYTPQEWVGFFNIDIVESKHNANRNNVTVSMALLANNKVPLVASSPTY